MSSLQETNTSSTTTANAEANSTAPLPNQTADSIHSAHANFYPYQNTTMPFIYPDMVNMTHPCMTIQGTSNPYSFSMDPNFMAQCADTLRMKKLLKVKEKAEKKKLKELLKAKNKLRAAEERAAATEKDIYQKESSNHIAAESNNERDAEKISDQQFSCKLCDEVFQNFDLLNGHCRDFHNCDAQSPLPSSSSTVCCPKCNKQFKNFKALNGHGRFHKDDPDQVEKRAKKLKKENEIEALYREATSQPVAFINNAFGFSVVGNQMLPPQMSMIMNSQVPMINPQGITYRG